MTYDDTEGVRELAKKHSFATALVSMKNTHHAEMREMLIGRDLSWARNNAMDRSVIALWLGHESIQTTEVYLHASMAMKEKALAKATSSKTRKMAVIDPTTACWRS